MKSFIDERPFLVRKKEGQFEYVPVEIIQSSSTLKLLDDTTRVNILKEVAKEPLYPAEIARRLQLHEQKIYYHIKQLMNAGFLEVVEKQNIRGTTAKKLAPVSLNYALCLNNTWKNLPKLGTSINDEKIQQFLYPFIENGQLIADIVVGSPDPHGPFKARARDSHYAIALSLFLGNYCTAPTDFRVRLDVDVNLEETKNHLILVGGPVTNLLVQEAHQYLQTQFSHDTGTWQIINKGKKKTYTDDSIGLIARLDNPFNKNLKILLFAGIRFIGTKAAVIALIKQNKELLSRFTGQKEFIAVVQGYDLDGDGRLDSCEVLE